MDREKPGKRIVSHEELMEGIRKIEGPAFTAPELAAGLDLSEDSARERLYNLVDKGTLSMKKPGHRTVVFWLTDDQQSDVSDA
jgi:predicted ArsR family transcriptional regulator